MRRLLVLALVLVPTASFAQFQLGARLGYAAAMGDAFKEKATGETARLKDGIKSQIPIQIDAGYKVNTDWSLGAYISYGFGQVGGDLKSTCDANGLDCSAFDVRVGVQGLYAFNQVKWALVPWLGVGLGYEYARTKAELSGVKDWITLTGFELNLQAGGDYKVSPKFSVGPYLMLSIGQYTKVTEEVSGTGSLLDGNRDVGIDKRIHEWLGFGVAGKFDF